MFAYFGCLIGVAIAAVSYALADHISNKLEKVY